MPQISTDELRKQLKERNFAPVYVLYGTETHLRDLAAKTIVKFSFNDGELREFNESEYSANTENGVRDALAAAEQLPMMASRRTITLSDVRIAATSNRDNVKEEHEPLLTAYLDRPSGSTVMVVVADELNATRKIGKLLRSRAVTVEFAPLDDDGVRKWAKAEFKKLGSTIEDRDIRQLVMLVGNDLRRLSNEIDKLATAALPDGLVTAELIEQLVPNTRELTNFALADGLNSGDRVKAMASLKKVLDDGAEPLMLLGSISYNYRRLMMVKDLMSRGVERGEIARILNMRYGNQEPFLAAARRADAAFLRHSLKRIAETDIAIKTSIGGSGPTGARLQLEILVAELASQGRN